MTGKTDRVQSKLKAFEDYIDAHEKDEAKAADKKLFVSEQLEKIPIELLQLSILDSAIKAARFKYE